MVEREPESRLREVVHQRVRLGVLAVLDRQGPCTFPQLRDALGQSDGGLSRHLGVLEEHGLITTDKVFENRRPRTWVSVTAAGTEAFREEQELLTKLLARSTDDAAGGDGTAAMTIVFAALLAEEGAADGSGVGADGDAGGAGERPALGPTGPVDIGGRRAEPVASGPVSARYDFPAVYSDFGREQREQRLMMISHGLRGGWITTWHVGEDEQVGDVAAHALVVELGGGPDCEAVLATMGPPTVDLPHLPAARGYVVPGGDAESPATAVAWFSTGPFLASVVIVGPAEVAVPALDHLVVEVHGALPQYRP